jgi:hypothetical protein
MAAGRGSSYLYFLLKKLKYDYNYSVRSFQEIVFNTNSFISQNIYHNLKLCSLRRSTVQV